MHSSTNARIETRSGAAARAADFGRLGKWQLDRKIGAGRWTDVYQARWDQCPHADYAVKVLKPECARDPSAIGLLQREARVCDEVQHRHLVSVLAAHVDHPPFFLVTPRLHGSTLRTMLDQQGSLETPYALWLVRQAAESLAALHRGGWLHADVKPDNLFVDGRGFVTLFDLGLAQPIGQGREILAGTPAYLPPEVFTRSEPWTGAGDVYGLGITLYEMLTGELPFPDLAPEDWPEAVLTRPPINPRRLVPTLSPRVVRLLRRMLAKNPLRRPLISELISWLVDLEIDTFAERPQGMLYQQ